MRTRDRRYGGRLKRKGRSEKAAQLLNYAHHVPAMWQKKSRFVLAMGRGVKRKSEKNERSAASVLRLLMCAVSVDAISKHDDAVAACASLT